MKTTLASSNLDSTTPHSSWSRYWWLPGVALAMVAFLPTLTFYFSSDDFTFVWFAAQHQPFYQSPQNLFYRPLPNLLWQFDYSLWHLQAFGYHLTNLLLHTANVWLVGLLTLKLTSNRATAMLSALLFALLPVHLEAVGWLAGRPDLLTTFFGLLALISWLAFSRTPKSWYYLLSLLAFGLAIFSKEAAAGLPFMMFGWAYLRRKPSKLRMWLNLFLQLIPFFLLILVYLTVRIAVLGGLGGYDAAGNSWLNSLWNATGGLWLPLLFPLNLQSFGWLITGALALILALFYGGLLWNWRKAFKLVSLLFALLLMYGGILPALPIAPVSTNLAQSRLLYLPSSGFCMLLAILFTNLNLSKLRISSWLKFGLVAIYVVGLVMAMEPWVVAGSLAHDTFSSLQQANLPIQSGDTIYYENLPDNFDGAYVWRNGLDDATHLLINPTVKGINRTNTVIVNYNQTSKGNIWFVNYNYKAVPPQLSYNYSYAVGNPLQPNVFADKNLQAQNWDLTTCQKTNWQLTLAVGKLNCTAGRGLESDLQGQTSTFSWQSSFLAPCNFVCYLQFIVYVDYDFQNPQIPATLTIRDSSGNVQQLPFELAADGKSHRYTLVIPKSARLNAPTSFNINTAKTRTDMRWQAFAWLH